MPSKKKQQSKKLKIVDNGYIVISTKHYNKYIREIMELPIKKRKIWKNTLLDKYGQSSSLRFIDGKLVNYSIRDQNFQVVKTREEIIKYLESNDNINLCKVDSVLGAGLLCGVSDRVSESLLTSAIQSNHTGNHYRNHSVSVPKSVYGAR